MSRDPFLDQSQDQGGPQVPALKAGQRLFNRRYELRQLLGAGGMGVVWQAWDHTEQIDVALKFLPTVLALQEREMQRLREEVRAGKELRHENLVATYGMEVEDGTAAIVMEYVAGETLRQKLDEQPRGFFEPDEIRPWVRDVCEGLTYLHEKARRIHRDLKPANIMIDENGRAKLMDFGISHRIKESVSRHSKTSEGQAGGSSSTLAYASPQQISGKPSDKADDIYSLGATLYELLTGTPPFFRGGVEAVRGQIKDEPVVSLLERRQELVDEGLNASTGQPVPTAVGKVILTCLAKKREDRPITASQITQSFNVPPEGQKAAPPRLEKARNRKPMLLGGLIAILVLLAWVVLFRPATETPVREIVKEVTKVVPDPAAAAEAARQKQRADELENKARDEEQKRLAADAEAAKAKDLAELAMKSVPKGIPVATTPANAEKSIPFINSLGMKFVPVPIGAGESKGQRLLFSIWETRSKDYAAFVEATGYDAGEDWKTGLCDEGPVGRGVGELAEVSVHPVACIIHDDAAAFCAWLTQKDRATGLIGPQDEYRLPTDTEWSYAVGIGDQEDAKASPKQKDHPGLPGIYPWGNTYPPPTDNVGNYADTATKVRKSYFSTRIAGYTDGYATTAPVGSFKCNALGIYDLGGNLQEWTSSPWESGSGSKVLRGGSWFDDIPAALYSSSRLSTSLTARDRGYGYAWGYGFRCVLVVSGG
jgi:serine/threonine protein kinase/formylglycine-generating enzyme required for sulfatase activity